MNEQDGGDAAETQTNYWARVRPGGWRRRRLVAGAIVLAATSSLGTLAFVGAATPSGSTLIAGLSAAVQPVPAPADTGKGKGTPPPTDDGKGKGKGTPAPSPSGKGATTDPASTDPRASAAHPALTSTDPQSAGSQKGTTTQPGSTTLANARKFAGFNVRTLDGLAGAQLTSVSIATVTFDGAAGRPSRPMVDLRYTLGQLQVDVVEVQDPFDLPASLQTYAEQLAVGGSQYDLMPRTGAVSAAETKESDGVSIVVDFFGRTAAGAVTGADRQTAYQVVRQLG